MNAKLRNICGKIKGFIFDIYRRNTASFIRMSKLKNIHEGERCFIIGNGPSLTVDDLERISKYTTFASNRIYKIFNQTNWRPTYYFSQDTKVLSEISYELDQVIKECKGVFLNSSIFLKCRKKYGNPSNLFYTYIHREDLYPNLPRFSFFPNKRVYEGFTVTYSCIQMAIYMGFKEIYLIGVDHNYNIEKKADGSIRENNGVKNYMKGLEGNTWYAPQLDKTTLAYIKSKEVCESKNIKIYNATRGGKLEVFNRISLDDVI